MILMADTESRVECVGDVGQFRHSKKICDREAGKWDKKDITDDEDVGE